MSAAWAAEYGGVAARPSPHPHAHAPPLGAAWVAEYQPPPPHLTWAAEYEAACAPGAAWAAEYEAGRLPHCEPTPAERRAARGAHPDDPLDDPAAPTWVASFNVSLGGTTVNGAATAEDAAEAAGLLTPRERNPLCAAPGDPAPAAATAAAAGHHADAELGWEAAVRRAPGNAVLWAALGRARAALGDSHRALAALRLAAGAAAPHPPPHLLLELADAALAVGGPRNAALATECVAQWAAAARVAPAVGTVDATTLDSLLAPFAAVGGPSGRASRDAAMALGALRCARGAHVAAADAYGAATAASTPDDPAPLLALGRALLAADRPDHAASALTAATRRAPGLPAAWRALARARARAIPLPPPAPTRGRWLWRRVLPGRGTRWRCAARRRGGWTGRMRRGGGCWRLNCCRASERKNVFFLFCRPVLFASVCQVWCVCLVTPTVR